MHVVVPWLRGAAPSPTTGSLQLEERAADIIYGEPGRRGFPSTITNARRYMHV
jgi:hypothetical protein